MYKNVIRSVFRSVGLEVTRYSPASVPDGQLTMFLARQRINVVLDVGANAGQFAVELRERMKYSGRIVSFEPMASAHAILCRKSASDALWDVAPRAAIGAEAGTVTLHLSGNSVSSSVLPMLEAHSSAAPQSSYIADEVVPMTTLDLAAARYIKADSRVFLKIDTQGYEAEVLKGASAVLQRALVVQLELSLVELYQGQALMFDQVRWMSERGFEVWAIAPAFFDSASGRLLQVDATFLRKTT
jgi:FkbM family methyltransferase